MTVLNAAMQKCGDASPASWGWGTGEAQDAGSWSLRPSVATVCGVVVMSGGSSTAPQTPANTAKVEKGRLSAVVSLAGTLTYRADRRLAVLRDQPGPRDVHRAARRPATRSDCGDVLYRVDEHPVLLLCGTVPAYRDLHTGDRGRDVWQLNRNLRRLGLPRRHRCRVHVEDRARPQGIAAPQGPGGHGQAPCRRRGLPARGGADREGDRRARRSRPAGCAGRAGHVRHARCAGRPRRVAAGRGEAGRPRADHAARPQGR